ncbi:hypothetical protein Cabys_123 [Caldithrix abyssi DSM 13497]|uniref:Uncharacterized protein n=1 Tax=Caldithrix abyssi DSM 13497 TaxID=880073 RepID=A0A1J1C4D2_CALAY|nr:hypothetical protein Cabys_123 [Caldithrix abyssi DSM 13497]
MTFLSSLRFIFSCGCAALDQKTFNLNPVKKMTKLNRILK